ncbi:hypothetical protein AMTR_s00087p00127940 [Amborella trichopoda]|uniref:Uncharacterized protein n=1 Tax=Amborella trichopoda TaxID=13333 RepID=W1P6H7_AMBTC|nr:hypothetical protein AMTR_s00087p00127940 [Amborella trichopoda]
MLPEPCRARALTVVPPRCQARVLPLLCATSYCRSSSPPLPCTTRLPCATHFLPSQLTHLRTCNHSRLCATPSPCRALNLPSTCTTIAVRHPSHCRAPSSPLSPPAGSPSLFLNHSAVHLPGRALISASSTACNQVSYALLPATLPPLSLS